MILVVDASVAVKWFVSMDPDEEHADRALTLQHHLFDTLYHAVALQTPGATLVTSDARYFAKATTEGSIALLSEFSVI